MSRKWSLSRPRRGVGKEEDRGTSGKSLVDLNNLLELDHSKQGGDRNSGVFIVNSTSVVKMG